MTTSCRLLFTALLLATLATADPLTITFSGMGSGMVGDQAFNFNAFTFTFETDTSLIEKPDCCTRAFSTPAGTPATFSIAGIGSGTLMGDQAVFANPSPNELAVGIWHADSNYWLDMSSTAAMDYDLSTSNETVPAASVVAFRSSFPTSMGSMSFDSLSDVTFTAMVDSVTLTAMVDSVPEPASVLLLGSGLIILCLALRRLGARREKA